MGVFSSLGCRKYKRSNEVETVIGEIYSIPYGPHRYFSCSRGKGSWGHLELLVGEEQNIILIMNRSFRDSMISGKNFPILSQPFIGGNMK